MSDLDARLIAAHARGDKDMLVMLYELAADAANDIDAACFYLTQAYVFALDRGHDHQGRLHARLAAQGRI